MVREDPQFRVRLPADLKERVTAAAKDNGRSINSEIVARLDRYDSLGGEADALEVVVRAIAEEIDEIVGEDPDFLHDRVGDLFSAVDEVGNVDKARLHREWTNEVSRRVQKAMSGAVKLPEPLLERIEAAAKANSRTVSSEILFRIARTEEADMSNFEAIARDLARTRKERDRYYAALSASAAADLDLALQHKLPPGLSSRVAGVAQSHGRALSEEVILALEEAYPAPAEFDLGSFLTRLSAAASSVGDDMEAVGKLVRDGNDELVRSGSEWRIRRSLDPLSGKVQVNIVHHMDVPALIEEHLQASAGKVKDPE